MATQAKTTISASTKLMSAVSMAAMVSDATLADMTMIFQAKEDTVRGPLVIMRDLVDDLGEEIKSVPLVDSENEDGKVPVTNNPDRYWTTKPMANGGSRKIRGSWINDFADSTSGDDNNPGGVEIDAKIAALTAKINDDLATHKEELKKDRGYWQGRKATNRNNYRRAFAAYQQSEAFKEHLPLLSMAVLEDDALDGDGKAIKVVTASKLPIHIWEKASPKNYIVCSLTTFLSFDPVKAAANKGTLDALTQTASRSGSTPDAKKAEPLAFKELEATVARINRLLEQNNIDKVVLKEAAKADVGKVFAHTLVDMYLMLQPLCEPLMPLWQQVEDEGKPTKATTKAA